MKNVIYILLLFCGLISAQNKALFKQANSLYNDGKYAEALDKYEKILDSDKHSAALYFNIANAHYKLNHIAPSIYYYEKASALKPNDKEIENNLAFANNMKIDAIDNLPETSISKSFNKVINLFSFDGWALTAVCLVVLFVLLYLLYYFEFDTGKKRLFFSTSLVSIFMALITLGLAFTSYSQTKNSKPAIVFAQETQVRTDPKLKSDEAFTLHEGTKIQVLDSFNKWKKIKLADGKTGWIANEDIKLLNIF